MDEGRIDMSVIIVSWNVKGFLEKCLGSIYKFTEGISFEVFVVDNNSSDGSVEMAAALFCAARLIRNKENLGFAAASNQALEKAAGRYILFLNPDTELTDNAFKKMADFMDTHQDAAAIGCKLLNSDLSVQQSTRHFPSLFTDLMENLYLEWSFPKSRFFNRCHMGFWDHSYTRQVDVPYGACLMVRNETLKKTGPMDVSFFMYYDEIDLCCRIKKLGGKIYYVSDISIIHHGNKSSNQSAENCNRWKTQSKLTFFKKHYGPIGIAGILFNLALQALILWGPLSLWHMLSGYPRDIADIKRQAAFNWREYMNFIKNQKGPAVK